MGSLLCRAACRAAGAAFMDAAVSAQRQGKVFDPSARARKKQEGLDNNPERVKNE